MKRAIIIVLTAAAVLLGAVLGLPVFLRPAFEKAARSTFSEKATVPVDFSDVEISLVKKFPGIFVSVKNIIAMENESFTGDTLFYARSVSVSLGWKSLFQQSGSVIKSLEINSPRIHLKVNNSGQKNWKFGKIANDEEHVRDMNHREETGHKSLKIQPENIKIADGSLSVENAWSKISMVVNRFGLELSGKMYNPSALVHAAAVADDVNLKSDGANLLKHARVETKTLLEVESVTRKLLIMNNELLINRLPLELSGSVEYPADSVFVNLLLKTRASDFDNFLALMPGAWSKNLAEAETGGIANATARIMGYCRQDNFPAFTLNVDVREGVIRLKGRSEELRKISVDAKISKPQGPVNLTGIVIKKAHAELNETPLDLKLNVSDLSERAHISGAVVGGVNFNDLKNFLSLDSSRFSGAMDVNLFFDSDYSDIKNGQYDKVKVSGLATMNNLVYDSPLLTRRINIPQGMMEFSPQTVFLRKLRLNTGESNMELSGKLSGYLACIFSSGTMEGTLNLTSGFVNFNELLRLKKRGNHSSDKEKQEGQAGNATRKTPGENPGEEVLAVSFPENLGLTVQVNIQKALFDRVPVTGINGLITLQEGVLNLGGLEMGLLGGEMKLTGAYRNTPENYPLFDFGFDLKRIDVQQASTQLTSLRRMMPVLGHGTGEIGAAIQLRGKLSPGLKIIGKTVNGNGNFSTRNLHLVNAPVFRQLEGILKPEILRNVAVQDFRGDFVINDGNTRIQPFTTRVAGQETSVRGNISAENMLDMQLDWKIQREAFGNDIQQILQVIPGNEKIQMVPAGVIIQGPAENPEVKMDLSETRKTVADATKGELQNSINRLGKSLNKLFGK